MSPLAREKEKAGNIFLVYDFVEDSHVLMIYESNADKYYLTKEFLEFLKKNNLECAYIFSRELEKMNLMNFYDKIHEFNIVKGKLRFIRVGDLENIYKKVEKLSKERKIGILVDYGTFEKVKDKEAIVDFEKMIHKISDHTLSLVNADVDQILAKELMKIHDRVLIQSEKKIKISFTPSIKEVNVDVVSSKSIEHSLKKNIDIVIAALLYKEPMCGFDIIKTLVRRYNVVLSQGTIYPLLYNFEKEGLLRSEISRNNKTKIYIPTEEGREKLRKMLVEHLITLKNIESLITESLESSS